MTAQNGWLSPHWHFPCTRSDGGASDGGDGNGDSGSRQGGDGDGDGDGDGAVMDFPFWESSLALRRLATPLGSKL